MRRIAKPLSLLLSIGIALMAAGCTPLPEIELYNHAAVPMMVSPGDQESCQLAQGGRCVFRFVTKVRIGIHDRNYDYDFPGSLRTEMSEEWVEFRPISRHVVKMQIEADGVIYILPATASGSVAQPPARQREGFPLRPRT